MGVLMASRGMESAALPFELPWYCVQRCIYIIDVVFIVLLRPYMLTNANKHTPHYNSLSPFDIAIWIRDLTKLRLCTNDHHTESIVLLVMRRNWMYHKKPGYRHEQGQHTGISPLRNFRTFHVNWGTCIYMYFPLPWMWHVEWVNNREKCFCL